MASPGADEIRALPKVELHAHLSGSITQRKLSELLEAKGDSFAPFDVRRTRADALARCFDYFDKVAKVVIDLAAVRVCALHVLDTFAAEHCIYLELRTSPKQFKVADGLTTKLQYLETIHSAIEEFSGYALERFGFVMEVRLLLSVDRGRVASKEEALAQIDDILRMSSEYPELVVGVDVCGNPSKATVVPFLIPALLERKQAFARLPITFHTAETKDDEESRLILDSMRELNIRRLGHVCFLPEDCRQRLLAGGILADGFPVGIELCPTSNLVTRELDSLKDHHWPDWWQQSQQVLLSVNTDDTGLFSCDLTSELQDLATAFDLTRDHLIEIQRQAVQSSFHPDKQRLLQRLEDAVREKPTGEPPEKRPKP